MKRILFVTMILGLLSCSQTKKGDTKTITNSSIENLVDNRINLKYPIPVDYIDSAKIAGLPDTMFFNLNNERILLLPNGRALNEKDSLVFDLKLEDQIDYIWFQEYDSDLVAIFVETDMDYAGGRAKRISLKDGSIKWAVSFGGFNMQRPITIDNYTYISTIGFVGKLDLKNGEFKWQFDNLYENGKYNNFEEPMFLENNKILFLSLNHGSSYADSIIVDDNQGKILKKN